jgi:DNA polymerase III epsilon subunit-like protein
MSKTILFLDTETTGLPTNWKAPYDQWPRMVSIAGQLYINGEYEAGFEYIIKPDGYEITKEASDIHGITQEIALEKGEDISFAMPWINGYINRADLIVFHNASFDVGIISGEQMRLEYPQTSLICHSNKIFCTKEKSTNICKIPNSRGGYKWPSLAELCAFCGVENQTAHNALSDVIATKECYFYMVEQGYF